MSAGSESPVMPATPTQVVPMETIRPRPAPVYYGEEPRRTGNICLEPFYDVMTICKNI